SDSVNTRLAAASAAHTQANIPAARTARTAGAPSRPLLDGERRPTSTEPTVAAAARARPSRATGTPQPVSGPGSGSPAGTGCGRPPPTTRASTSIPIAAAAIRSARIHEAVVPAEPSTRSACSGFGAASAATDTSQDDTGYGQCSHQRQANP